MLRVWKRHTDGFFVQPKIGPLFRTILAGSVGLLVSCLLLPPTANAQQDSSRSAPDPARPLAEQQAEHRREFDALAKDIELSDTIRSKLKAEIAKLDRDLTTLRDNLLATAQRQKQLDEDIALGERRLSLLREDEANIRSSLLARRGILAEVLAALQRMGRNPPPALLVTPDDALSSVRSAILLGAVVPEIREETEALVADLAAIKNVRTNIELERKNIVSKLESSAEESERLALLLKSKETIAAENNDRLAEENQRAQVLAQRANTLNELISSMEAEIESVRQAADAASEQAKLQRSKTAEQLAKARELAQKASPDKNRIAPAYAFSALTGTLITPVSGVIAKRFGEDDGTGRELAGDWVTTPFSAIVTAPADGWVVYAGPFRRYGQLLILNVGEDYHIVLAGMDQINVNQGQFVIAGEPVARMGETRIASASALTLVSDRPTLYIEFRKDGKPINSQPWWAAAFPERLGNGS